MPAFTAELLADLRAGAPNAETAARDAAAHVLRLAEFPDPGDGTDPRAAAVSDLVEAMRHSAAGVSPQAHARRVARDITSRARRQAPDDTKLAAAITTAARNVAGRDARNLAEDIAGEITVELLTHMRRGRPVDDLDAFCHTLGYYAVRNVRVVDSTRGLGGYRDARAGELTAWWRQMVETHRNAQHRIFLNLDVLSRATLWTPPELTTDPTAAPINEQSLRWRGEATEALAAHMGWTLERSARTVHVLMQDAAVQVATGQGVTAGLYRLSRAMRRSRHAQRYAAAARITLAEWWSAVRFLCGRPAVPAHPGISAEEAAARGVTPVKPQPARPAVPGYLAKIAARRPTTSPTALERAA